MNAFAGTGKLIRLVLRRDRVLLPLWVAFVCMIPVVFVSAFTGAYPTAEARQHYYETSVHTRAFTIAYGVLNGSSLGELVAWRSGFVTFMVALFALLTVIRHTRTEEEAGRRELVGATAVSRHADLAAALIVTCGAALVLGVGTALALIGQGLPAAGSLALGLEFTVAACAFASIGAVTAQLTTGAGGARAIGISTLGAAILLRGVGDVAAQSGDGPAWVSWLTPLGWAEALRPYSGERWWVLALAAGAMLALIMLAVALSERRDLGVGMLQARLGPAAAGPCLSSPLALAWRLHRGPLISRLAGLALVGLVGGAMSASLGTLMNNSAAARETLARLGGPGTLVDQFLAPMMTMLGLVSAGFAIQAALLLRNEERDGRAEPLLATPVRRLRWAGSHVAFILLGPALGLIAFGTAAGLAHGLNTGDVARELSRLLAAALVQLPVVWVFTGVAFALYGLLPRLVAGTFVVAMVSMLFGWVGLELQLDQWVIDLSVFEHVPKLPGGVMTATPLIVMTVVAAALIAAGLAGFTRRDMPTT
ncbi:ABC transporter permease [Nonomuraea diastatica]|uniref:ABC transporter permease n=1 Tax=Nonomuraea diastatica TaxID=1848329 RepID=A0A4R4WVF2_9ACTN|nr:ABC transporter permease [Nonomuraea diastatica]TDD21612.1 ABC transporter permease [Nonomuraea diastatica]